MNSSAQQHPMDLVMPVETSDQRSEPRLPASLRVFIDHKRNRYLKNPDKQFIAVDCSEHGLRLKGPADWKRGEWIHIRVAIDFPLVMFELKGQVRWTRNLGESVMMGVLLDEAACDYQDWSDRFQDLFNAELSDEEQRWFDDWQRSPSGDY